MSDMLRVFRGVRLVVESLIKQQSKPLQEKISRAQYHATELLKIAHVIHVDMSQSQLKRHAPSSGSCSTDSTDSSINSSDTSSSDSRRSSSSSSIKSSSSSSNSSNSAGGGGGLTAAADEQLAEAVAAFAWGLSCGAASCLTGENSVFDVADAASIRGGMKIA